MSKDVKNNQKIDIVSHVSDFFQQQLTQLFESQNIKVEATTKVYLVDLLNRFMLVDNFFAKDKNGESKQEVLALLLTKAIENENPHEKQDSLRRLGEVSLYTAGFFSDSLSRKLVDVDYYITMGKTAYFNLATLAIKSEFKNVFQDVSVRFEKFVDVLAELSLASACNDSKNILRVYEVWLKTRSQQAEKTLQKVGIIANRNVKPDWQ